MTKYLIGVNYTKQKRFLHHSKKLIVIPILLLFLTTVAIFVDSYINNRLANAPSQASSSSTSTVAPNVNIFTTDYFQFQTDKQWGYIKDQSTTNKYIYRRINKNIISADLTVYINSAPEISQVTRILPVELNESNKTLKTKGLSGHCRENIPAGERSRIGEKEISLSYVRFLCDVDQTQFTAMAGKVGGTTTMNFVRSNGKSADYIIFYRDLRAIALSKEFEDIINTFQIR